MFASIDGVSLMFFKKIIRYFHVFSVILLISVWEIHFITFYQLYVYYRNVGHSFCLQNWNFWTMSRPVSTIHILIVWSQFHLLDFLTWSDVNVINLHTVNSRAVWLRYDISFFPLNCFICVTFVDCFTISLFLSTNKHLIFFCWSMFVPVNVFC